MRTKSLYLHNLDHRKTWLESAANDPSLPY